MMIMEHECFIPTDRQPGERNCSNRQRKIRSRVHVANDTKRFSQSNQTKTRATTDTKRSYLRQFLILSSIGFVTFRTALSFPTGAGGCEGDQSAVGGSHLSPLKTNFTGELFEAGLEFYLAGLELNSSILTDEFPTNTDLEIGILATTDSYRGFLIRLQVPDTTPPIDTSSALLPTGGSSDPQTQIASICVAPVVGITHLNPSIKDQSTGILNIPEEADNVILDVTVVLINSPNVTIYFYSRFLVNFRSSGTVASTSTNLPTTTKSTNQPTITSTVSIPTLLPSSRTTIPTEIPSTSKTMPSALPTTTTTEIASDPPMRTLSSEPTNEPVASPPQVPINIPSRSPPVPKTRIPTTTIPFKRSRTPSSPPTADSPSHILASAEPTKFDFPSKKTKGNGKGMTMNEGKGMMMMSEGKGMMMTSKGKRMMMTQGGKGMTMMSGIGGSKSSKSSSKEKKNFKSKGKKNRGKGSSKLLKYSKTSKEERISSNVEVNSTKKSKTIDTSKTSKEGKTRSNRTNLDLPERGIDLPDVTEVGATVAPSNYNSDYNTEDITDDDTFTDSAKSRNAATAPPSSREGKALTVKIDQLLNFEIKSRPHRTNLNLPDRGIDIYELPQDMEFVPTMEPSNYYSGNKKDNNTNDNAFVESEKALNEATVQPYDSKSVDTTANMDSSNDENAQVIKELIESPFDNAIQIRLQHDYQQTGAYDSAQISTRANEDDASLNSVPSFLAELWSDKPNIFGNTISTGRIRSPGRK